MYRQFRNLCLKSDINDIEKFYNENTKQLNKFMEKLFVECCNKGNINIMRWIYNKKTIDLKKHIEQLLISCCSKNYLDIIKWIYNLNPSFITNNNKNCFIEAIENGNIDVAEWIYKTTNIEKKFILDNIYRIFNKKNDTKKFNFLSLILDKRQLFNSLCLSLCINDNIIFYVNKLFNPLFICDNNNEFFKELVKNNKIKILQWIITKMPNRYNITIKDDKIIDYKIIDQKKMVKENFYPKKEEHLISDIFDIPIFQSFFNLKKQKDDDVEYNVEPFKDEINDLPDNINVELKNIFKNIKSIEDIIELENKQNNELLKCKRYERLIKTIPSLKNLKKMIGLENIKNEIFNHICYFVEEFNKDELMNIIIYGEPGTGKTELGKIIAKLYLNLGFLKNDKIVFAKRSDLIGKFVGHTAPQTQNIIDSALGGVLFIDEVYSLGDSDKKRDTFSKECIDVINRNLTEHKGEFLCIIAGYKKEVDEYFFSVNRGLERRFPIRFNIEGYTANELKDIFLQKVENYKIKCSDEFMVKFFTKNKSAFKFYGGDIEIFVQELRFVIGKKKLINFSYENIITEKDLEDTIKNFVSKREQPETYNLYS